MTIFGEFLTPVQWADPQTIQDDPPTGFNPTQVIFRQLSFLGGSHYSVADKPVPIDPAVWRVEDYVRDIIANGYRPGKPDVPEDKPLAIPVRADSYIVVSTRGNVFFPYFADLDPAIQLQASNMPNPPADDIYGELRHYNPATGQFSATPCSGCEYIYFSAAANPADGYKQKFNYGVLDVRGTTHWIDPDIRYPGNGGVPGPRPDR